MLVAARRQRLGSRVYYRHCSSMQLSLRAPPAGSGIVVASQRKDGGSVAAAAEKDVEDFEAEWQRAARFDAGELNAASSWVSAPAVPAVVAVAGGGCVWLCVGRAGLRSGRFWPSGERVGWLRRWQFLTGAAAGAQVRILASREGDGRQFYWHSGCGSIQLVAPGEGVLDDQVDSDVRDRSMYTQQRGRARAPTARATMLLRRAGQRG